MVCHVVRGCAASLQSHRAAACSERMAMHSFHAQVAATGMSLLQLSEAQLVVRAKFDVLVVLQNAVIVKAAHR